MVGVGNLPQQVTDHEPSTTRHKPATRKSNMCTGHRMNTGGAWPHPPVGQVRPIPIGLVGNVFSGIPTNIVGMRFKGC